MITNGFGNMKAEYIGNIRGPEGKQGEQGKRGYPGINQVPADQFIAAMIDGDGDETSTRDALLAYLQTNVTSVLLGNFNESYSWDGARSNSTSTYDDGAGIKVQNLASNPSFEKGSGVRQGPGTSAFRWRVGSYNVRSANASVTSPTNVYERPWDVRVPSLAADIQAASVSIVGLQEADAGSSGQAGPNLRPADSICALLGSSWKSETRAVGGLAIIWNSSVWDAVAGPVQEELISATANVEGFNRTCLWMIMRNKASGQRVAVISTHFPSGAEATHKPSRLVAAQALASVVNRLRSTYDVPVIVTGDFNSRIPTAAGNIGDTLATAGLRDSHDAAPSVTNAGYDSIQDFTPSLSGFTKGEWLDRVFVTGEAFTVASAGQVLRFASGNTPPLALPIGSDHNLVWAEVLFMPDQPFAQGFEAAAPVVGGNASVFLSEKFSRSGSKSLAIAATAGSTSATGYYLVDGPSGRNMGRYLNMRAGGTYAIAAWVYVPAVLTGALDSQRLGINVGINKNSNASDVYWNLASARAENKVGWQRVALAVTIPSDATNVFVRLMNGSATAGDTVYWDDLIITTGSTQAEALARAANYFDGDTMTPLQKRIAEVIQKTAVA